MARIPNLVELGRIPDKPRYTWVILIEGKLYTGSTWLALQRLIDKTKAEGKKIQRVMFVDIVSLEITEFTLKELVKVLEEWRAKYFTHEKLESTPKKRG